MIYDSTKFLKFNVTAPESKNKPNRNINKKKDITAVEKVAQTINILNIALFVIMECFVVLLCTVQCCENGIAAIARHVKVFDKKSIVLIIIVVGLGGIGMPFEMFLQTKFGFTAFFAYVTC